MKEIYGALFTNSTGKSIGSWVEKKLVPRLFRDVDTRGANGHFDGKFAYGKKIKKEESKCFRAVYYCKPAESTLFDENSFSSRALFSHEDHDKGIDRNGKVHEMTTQAKFQQVKPGEFDWMIGVAIFLDKIRVYLVPSKHIAPCTKFRKSGKIRLTPQHRNEDEGQVMVKDLPKYMILEITTPLNKIDKGIKGHSYLLANYI